MANGFYGYQYDTNPRKLNSANRPYRNAKDKLRDDMNKELNKDDYLDMSIFEHKNKKVDASNQLEKNKKNNVSNVNKNKVEKKHNTKMRLKIVMFVLTSFSVLFALSYQNSLISESFNKKEQYKKQLESLSKTNQQIQVNIENNLNLNNIEQAASEKLGMQKLNNNQKIYVSLPKQDYIAPATEQVIIEEEVGFFEKLFRCFTN
ncbi:MAG: hypothetical protein E7313_07590 [Clostridiales bacterium]|nr:hypothetical protein [Clostridiales bacterium]